MRRVMLLVCCGAASLLALPLPASSENREEYLSRLREVCAPGCMQPRELLRTARKRVASDESDLAIIMDVAEVRRSGSRFELLNLDLSRSVLEEIDILGSAGVNTSSRSGIGGLPRGSQGGTDPNLIIVEMDEQTLYDILNIPSPLPKGSVGTSDAGEIVVGGDRERVVAKPTLGELRTFFRNRRVVVRGKPRLAVVMTGARRDFRRKQLTLELGNADDLVMLPRFDDNGDPVLEGSLEGLGAQPTP